MLLCSYLLLFCILIAQHMVHRTHTLKFSYPHTCFVLLIVSENVFVKELKINILTAGIFFLTVNW